MRLTLRTLLAYMDDVLDPADQEELGRKIESSPFATELIHRSRDAVRRARLTAPDPLAGDDDDLHGGDHNLDANTAAEYLDNTLSPEAVGDFERSCLEAGPNADMLLAEAASCHHVLTMVLGEPAEVDADLRQRMYALAQSPAAAQQMKPEAAANAPAPSSAPAPVAAAAVAPPAAIRTRQVDPDEASVPDFMRAAAVRERRRSRRMLATVVGAVLLGGVATWFFMPGGEAKVPPEVAAMGDVDAINEGPTVDAAEEPATTTSTGEADDSAGAQSADAESEAPPFNPGTATTGRDEPPTLETPKLEPPPLETPPEVTLPPETPATGADASAAAAVEAPAIEPGTTAATATLPSGETPAPPADAEPPMVDAATTEASPAGAAEVPPATSEEPPVGATASDASSASQLPPPPATATATGDAPASLTPSGVGPIAAATPSAPADTAATGPMADADAEAAPAAPAQPKAIGAYLGNNDVLLKYDPAAKGWIRLPPRSAFTGGEQLLALPTFRTHVVLADVNVYLSGGAQIDLIPPGQNTGEPAAELALHIPYGQVVFNSGLNGNRIELSLVDQTRVVQLGPSSSLAVDVKRVFEPGGATKRVPAPAEVTWYLTSGTATWGESGSAEAPASWTTVGGEDSVPVAIEELPAWVDQEPINDNERRARERIAGAMVPGEEVNVRLLELSDPNERGRRTEDRALAARSGAYVGMYDPLVTALGDVNQRAGWKDQIEALRQAIARDPAAMEGIHAAFALERGQESADDLMEMLLGFDRAEVGTTRQEVQNGALVRLLRWMENDDLVYRVLAAHDANEILGTRDLGGYKPEQSASQRDRMLGRVWERFERGELMPAAVKPNG